LKRAGARDWHGASPFSDQGSERRGAPALVGLHRRLDRVEVERPTRRRTLEATAQRPVGDGPGEIDLGPRGAGAGDAVDSPNLLPPRLTHLVRPDAVDSTPTPAWGDHVDDHRPAIQQTQERRRAAVGDHRPRSAGEGRGEQPPAFADPRMPDRIGAAEDAMQATETNRARDRRLAHPQSPQLVPRNDPVLPSGESGQGDAAVDVRYVRYSDITRSAARVAPAGLERWAT
jgi:hypothetical protein